MPHAELAAPDDEIVAKYKTKFPNETSLCCQVKRSYYGLEMAIPGYQFSPIPHATFAAMVDANRCGGGILGVFRFSGWGTSWIEWIEWKYCNHFLPPDKVRTRRRGRFLIFFVANGVFRRHKRRTSDEGGIPYADDLPIWPGKNNGRFPKWSDICLLGLTSHFRWAGRNQGPEKETDGIIIFAYALGNARRDFMTYLYWGISWARRQNKLFVKEKLEGIKLQRFGAEATYSWSF